MWSVDLSTVPVLERRLTLVVDILHLVVYILDVFLLRKGPVWGLLEQPWLAPAISTDLQEATSRSLTQPPNDTRPRR